MPTPFGACPNDAPAEGLSACEPARADRLWLWCGDLDPGDCVRAIGDGREDLRQGRNDPHVRDRLRSLGRRHAEHQNGDRPELEEAAVRNDGPGDWRGQTRGRPSCHVPYRYRAILIGGPTMNLILKSL